MTNKIDLGGRNAIVTGGAQGIGRAIVERFLDSGAAIAIWDRDIESCKKDGCRTENRGRVDALLRSMSPNIPTWSARATRPSRLSSASTSW